MTTVLAISFGCLAVAFGLAIVRAIIGPSVADRAIATDVGLYAIIAGLPLVAVATGASAFIDVALIAVLLGFLATVALAALVGRRDT